MENLIMAGQLLLGLSLLIVLHEWGHYYPARLFKTRVEKFYLFFDAFNFSLFKKKIGDTVYGIGWLPLGGYVKISGMIDESMDKEQMAGPPQPWEFRSKPAWQRLIIMLGGVTVNLILGFFIYSMTLYTWGREISDPSSFENGVMVHPMVEEYGFENGDRIIEYANIGVKDFGDMAEDILLFDLRDFKVQKADGETKDLRLPEDITLKMLETKTRALFSPRSYVVIGDIIEGSPAAEAGLQVNDSVVGINEQEIIYFDEFRKNVKDKPNQAIDLSLFRKGERMNITVTVDSMSMIGFSNKGSFGKYDTKTLEYGFFESFPAGINYGWRKLRGIVNSMKYVFTKEGSKQVGSFISFAKAYGAVWEWQRFWSLTALISIILAFMNVLPIPALDGGHVMFLLYEMISGKAPSQKFMEIAQMIGFFLLIGLIIFALKNDVVNHLLN